MIVTDGLALVRELMGVGKHTILVVDEVHEMNRNIEVLLAWVRYENENGANIKLVLMRASAQVEPLSDFFNNAPIIRVPGRAFPVEELPRGKSLEEDVANLLRQGHDVLVFQPGRGEIEATITAVQALGVNAVFLPLYGELSPEEQALCFQQYAGPKCVVATNVAETSITIPGLTAVVDSGMERRMEVEDGVERLCLRPISLANAKQRRGRAGRTESGVYIDWCPATNRPAFPVAEIDRTLLDQTVLQLAEVGMDMEKLRFVNQPDLAKIHQARESLVLLGCMNTHGKVTALGRRVAKMHMTVQYARMIIAAETLGVVDDVITIAAILEQGGINARVCPLHKKWDMKTCQCWTSLAPGERTSDVYAQLLAYKACLGMTSQEMRDKGISPKAFHQAKEKRRLMSQTLRGTIRTFRSSGDKENILRAVCAGMVGHVYVCHYGKWQRGGEMLRELARESVVVSHTVLVGKPVDIEYKNRYGVLGVILLVRMATAVVPEWLVEAAPHLASVKPGLTPRYDHEQGEVVSTIETTFNGQVIERREVLDPTHPDAAVLRRNARNVAAWQQWLDFGDKPMISLPRPSLGDITIPDVVSHVYGHDANDGAPLTAYGAVTNDTLGWLTQNWFKVSWTQSLQEAQRWRDAAIAVVAARWPEHQNHALRQAAARQAELTATARSLRDQANNLLLDHGSRFDDGLHSRLDGLDVEDFQLPRDTIGLDWWIERAQEIIAEANNLLAQPASAAAITPADLSDLLARFGKR